MLLVLAACTTPTAPASVEPSADSADTGEFPGGAEADVVYDVTALHEVIVTMADADWAALRVQERNVYELFGEGCMDAPWGSPYTWFDAEVQIDGEALGPVGVRKKGLLGSVTADRPSLRVSMDHLVPGATYHGLEKLVLNNGRQDPSRLRTCLAHQFFADAGLVAPRCALAHVTVNGEDLGVYAQTEAIDELLIARDEGVRPASLYEGTLSDFREGWLATFEAESVGADGAELTALTEALAVDDDGLLAALDQVVDLDRYVTFWVAESLAGHWDGYNGNTNNFYVYASGLDGRLRFIASGPDSVWDSRTPFGAASPLWVATAGSLSNRLIQHGEGRERFLAEMERQLDEVWNEDTRLAQIDEWADLVGPVDDSAQRDGIASLRSLVRQRANDLAATLGGRFESPALRGELCWSDVGVVTVDFATTWGSYPDGDLFTGGAAETTYEINGAAYLALESGASAGWADEGGALWLTISRIADETWLAPYVVFDEALATPGATIPIDGVAATAMLLYNSPDTGGAWTNAAYLGNGSLHFEDAGTRAGDALVGRLDVRVLGQAE
ncbi:MAG: hypothetical protein EXR71_16275 [Myxococcales bacterium]|nr:hypothetical protein [Myxococcales bacterium]